MDATTVLGLAAGTLTTIAFVPQVVKIWRNKSADDISYGTFILFSIGLLIWLLYGIAIEAPPIIAANAITLLLAVIILVLKARYDRALVVTTERR